MIPSFWFRRVCKRNVQIAVCFNLHSDNAPVRANHLFSIPVRSERQVIRTFGPGQLNISLGVTAWIALASVGGIGESFLTAQPPLL